MPVSAGLSEPESFWVLVTELQPSLMVKVRIISQPQLSPVAGASVWVTLMVPQSEYRALMSLSLASTLTSASFLQWNCPVTSSGQVPVSAGGVWSEPESFCVLVTELQPSLMVKVRTISQPQLSPVAAASVWVTVMGPQSE